MNSESSSVHIPEPVYGQCSDCGVDLEDGYKYRDTREERYCFECGEGVVLPVGARDFDRQNSSDGYLERAFFWSSGILSVISVWVALVQAEHPQFQVLFSGFAAVLFITIAVHLEIERMRSM